MIFKKPEDIRYVDMAKYVDENAYKEDKDESLIYEYIFHLSRMVSLKRKLFVKWGELDDFSLYLTGYVMRRYQNKKQFRANNRMTKIKSVLNYIKRVAYPVKVRYQNEVYATKKVALDSIDVCNVHNFRDSIINSSKGCYIQEFDLYLNDIPGVIWEYVKKTPYRGVTLKNVYISCLLTLMSGMTLSNTQQRRLDSLKTRVEISDSAECKMYEKEREYVILYHLSDTMRDYIRVLCSRIRNIIIEDLNYLLTSGFGESELRDMLADCVENV